MIGPIVWRVALTLAFCSHALQGLADLGPVPKAKALTTARAFLRMAKVRSDLPYYYRADSRTGEHGFQFGEAGKPLIGGSSVHVDSWSGDVVQFENSVRIYEWVHRLRDGRKRVITTNAQGIREGLLWAGRLGIPRGARIPGPVRFGSRPTVGIGLREPLPHRKPFLGGYPNYAVLHIDVTDRALVNFRRAPKPIVESWTLRMDPLALRSTAVSEYRKGMLLAKEKPTSVLPRVDIGYTRNPAKDFLYDPSKGRREHYMVLGIRFTFSTFGEMGMKDWVEFDAGTGKLLTVFIAERHHHERMPPDRPDRIRGK